MPELCTLGCSYIRKQMNKKHIIIFGVVSNLIATCLFVAFPIRYYSGWDTFHKINPDNWLATDERLLHLLCYGFLPFGALIMLVSVVLFWKLRK